MGIKVRQHCATSAAMARQPLSAPACQVGAHEHVVGGLDGNVSATAHGDAHVWGAGGGVGGFKGGWQARGAGANSID